MTTTKPLRLAMMMAVTLATLAQAAPASYKLDPTHTYPSFEADHMGISVWRGKMTKSNGSVVYDKAAGTGTLKVTVDLAAIDFGLEMMNKWARGKDFFDVKKHPRATYTGRFDSPVNGVPTKVLGELTLHGVTRPVELTVHALKCIPHPMLKRELCGADASGTFMRDEFGLDAGKAYGFKMNVNLRIQAEAVAEK